uniref:HEPN_MAE_28990 domain-containing protein n=1 Tax=Rhabditophanes sp. KR3021 TaxID=114890 RepID=A0AC35UHT1_9BILA
MTERLEKEVYQKHSDEIKQFKELLHAGGLKEYNPDFIKYYINAKIIVSDLKNNYQIRDGEKIYDTDESCLMNGIGEIFLSAWLIQLFKASRRKKNRLLKNVRVIQSNKKFKKWKELEESIELKDWKKLENYIDLLRCEPRNRYPLLVSFCSLFNYAENSNKILKKLNLCEKTLKCIFSGPDKTKTSGQNKGLFGGSSKKSNLTYEHLNDLRNCLCHGEYNKVEKLTDDEILKHMEYNVNEGAKFLKIYFLDKLESTSQ